MQRKRGKRFRKPKNGGFARNISIETVTEEPEDASFNESTYGKIPSGIEPALENLKARRISSINRVSKRLEKFQTYAKNLNFHTTRTPNNNFAILKSSSESCKPFCKLQLLQMENGSEPTQVSKNKKKAVIQKPLVSLLDSTPYTHSRIRIW